MRCRQHNIFRFSGLPERIVTNNQLRNEFVSYSSISIIISRRKYNIKIIKYARISLFHTFFIFLFMIKEKCANTQKLRSRRIEKLSSSYVPSIQILNYKKLFIPAQKYSITRFLQLSYIRRLEHFFP